MASQPTPDELADTVAHMARLLARTSMCDTLDRVTQLAVELVPGCEHSAVSFADGDEISTRAPSDDLAVRVDALQYDTDEGPCLDAIRLHEIVSTDDLSIEARWPEFAPRAVRETGVRSVASFRMIDDHRSIGSLNLYSTAPSAFDGGSRATGAVLAAQAAVAISAASTHDHLRAALASRDVIGQAKGILMVAEGLTADEAFERLRQASQHLNRKVVDIAGELASTGTMPGDGDRDAEPHEGRPGAHPI